MRFLDIPAGADRLIAQAVLRAARDMEQDRVNARNKTTIALIQTGIAKAFKKG